MSATGRLPALEIGGTHVAAAVVDGNDWSVRDRLRMPIDPHAEAATLLAAIAAAAARLPVPSGCRWGVAMPDPFDYAAGVAWFADVGKFDALYGIAVAARLHALIPATPATLTFCNDADAFTLGETLRGAAVGATRCAGITLGTGLGTGWVVDGRITVDEPGIPELGRARTIQVDGIGLEELVSTRGIRSRFAARGGAPDFDVAGIVELARAGDAVAAGVLRDTFGDLGRGLGPALRAFAPQVIVIGGSMTASWDVLAANVEAGLAWPGGPPIRVAESTEAAALRGAARAALTASG